MTIFYIDFENGNDANAGTSFATRWKTITNGATAARIAPGDEIRIMASPDPTSIGNATWTGGGRRAAINISSSTNATPIVITSSGSHGLSPGDYVVIGNHSTNTNANGVWKVGTTPTSTTFQILQIDGSNTTGNGSGGATGTLTRANNLIIKTATPLVQNIALCGGLGQKPAWTASANVSATQAGTIYKEGYSAASIAINATFTTGKAAYYTLPATLDLSGYQQVSFWVRLASGTVGAAGQTYVALCSDATGDTVVHQCPVPALGATGVWVPVTVDLGTNLSSTIRSVAFYVVTDVGAQTFYLDDIIACKAASSADSINLQSLVSKSDGTGDEAWYSIQSINSDVIMLANASNGTSTDTGLRGYNGASETITTYKRETVKTTPATAFSSNISLLNDSGALGSLITYSGGWNRTDMSTQTGRTWLDGLNGYGYGLTTTTTRSFISIDKIDLCRYDSGVSTGNGLIYSQIGSMYCTGNNSIGFNFGTLTYNNAVTALWANNNYGTGVSIGGYGNTITSVKDASSNRTNCIVFGFASECFIGSAVAGNSSTEAGVVFSDSYDCVVGTATITNSRVSSAIATNRSFNNYINGGSSSGNSQGISFVTSASNVKSTLYLNNFTIGEATEIGSVTSPVGAVYSNRHDNTDGNNWVFQPALGTINQQTAVVDSPATTAWRMAVTSANASASAPLKLKLGTVVCAAGSLVTVTARMYRQFTTMTMRLVCPGGQISGVSDDVTSDLTAAGFTWDTVTITFTPTKPGGVDIYAYAFGTSTSIGYVCNLTASQA